MARKYANRVWMTTTTAGTGTITLGSVKSGDYFTFAEAGVSDGDTVAYVIVDGSNVEIGIGTYTSSGTTLSRDTVIASRIAGVAGTTKVTLSGNATVFIAEQATEAQAVYDLLENLAANSVLARADAAAGAPSGVALSASQLLGRGSTGNVAPISLGTNLSMSGTTMDTTGVATLSGNNTFTAATNTFEGGYLLVKATDAGATALPDLVLERISASPAASDDIGRVVYGGYDSGAGYTEYAVLQGTIIDPTNASEDGGLDVDLVSAGTLDRRFRFEPEIRYGYNNAGANQGVVREEHWIKLASDYTLANSTAEQKLFNTTTNGRLTLGTGTYFFDALLYLTTMSGSSGNMAFDPIGGGTAVGARFLYHSVGIDNNSPLNSGTQTGSVSASQQSNASMLSAGTGSGMAVSIRGTFRITTAGTIIPSGTLVTAAAAVVKAGSYFRIWRAGEESTNSVGAWD